ncbi:putative integral membrane protein [Aspergillus novofumigatus IBT 16806]|uniref:Putative integral membrane protein n=1 Tax=Aspergillus novofumigatus (strain IBT 16806) TaxID=1392255 RepID=A0A2I1CG57_ASPN1|nr:putative integral membrane protein [Aspergillus novofumigatus IBT 16806]PKX96578.1 putative integral membrane protein [Aspergillus novofumigatus IBT 16806]
MALAVMLGRDVGDSVDTSMQNWNTATQILCIVAMTVFFGLRVYTRIFILNGFGKEDCAWSVMYSIISLIMGHYGGGLHQSDVPNSYLIPFHKTVYVTMVMYGPTAFLTKISLLWIMTRVFSPYRKAVLFIYVFLVIMLLYYIPAVIVKIRICNPIARFWDENTNGTCLDQSAIILADAVVSVVSDMIILILPLPLTLSLQMAMRKKLRVMGILGAGGLACASSIVRLILILKTGQSKDGTYSFMRINMFGNAEIAIGVICACLPSLSALLSRVLHEYSSNNKATHTSTHELSKVTKQSRTDRRLSRSKHQMSYLDTGSDQEILMHNAQGDPKIETSIRGILDVSTSVTTH